MRTFNKLRPFYLNFGRKIGLPGSVFKGPTGQVKHHVRQVKGEKSPFEHFNPDDLTSVSQYAATLDPKGQKEVFKLFTQNKMLEASQKIISKM